MVSCHVYVCTEKPNSTIMLVNEKIQSPISNRNNPLDIMLADRKASLNERTRNWQNCVDEKIRKHEYFNMREIVSEHDREVIVFDRYTGEYQKMLMFGSNNYLGLANHPYVKQKVKQAIDDMGVGIGGSPILNGYTRLHRQLEERLSGIKKTEDTLLFSSGYSANIGMITALVKPDSTVIFDEHSHASFYDGLKMIGGKELRIKPFKHNNMFELEYYLRKFTELSNKQIFVGVEGVYSLDGDTAPLDKIASLCKEYNSVLLLDDANGTGITGKNGFGTAEKYGVEGSIDITMGSFSKTFAVTGGFISSSKPLVSYLRYMARSGMFSASLPPIVVSAVLAGIDIMESEKFRLEKLHENVKYAANSLNRIGLFVSPQAAIISLIVPPHMNISTASRCFHEKGIFINTVEYPAVPLNKQRFRISITANHTFSDIDRLTETINCIWKKYAH